MKFSPSVNPGDVFAKNGPFAVYNSLSIPRYGIEVQQYSNH